MYHRHNSKDYAQKIQQFQKDLELEQIRREYQLRETQLEDEKEQEKHDRDMEILRLHSAIQKFCCTNYIMKNCSYNYTI